ncbi:MAG: hypothetical protein ACR2HC_05665 [Thermoleophilaceae bacterium]
MIAEYRMAARASFDRLLAAMAWADSLYPENGWLVNDETVSEVIVAALDDSDEPFTAARSPEHANLLVPATGRVQW